MADSCEWIFLLFGRHHSDCKSRIFERMENFQNDCCRPWTKTRFKNSCSKQLRIVNAVVGRSPAGQIDWTNSVFLQDKVMLFETMMTTMNEVNTDKTKVPDYFFPVMFRLTVLLLNSMSKLIHTHEHVSLLSWNSTATYVYASEQLHVCFDLLICYSLLFSSEIILKQLFPSGSVNIVE